MPRVGIEGYSISYFLHGIEIETQVSNPRIRTLLDGFLRSGLLARNPNEVSKKLKVELIETPSSTTIFRESRKPFLHLSQFGIMVWPHEEGFFLRYFPEATFYWEPKKKELTGWLRPSVLIPPEKFLYAVMMPVLRIIFESYRFFSIHAACVSKRNRAMLLFGGPGGGKSTLSFALARRGFGVLADDRPFLGRPNGNLQVFSVPERLALERASIALFPETCSHPGHGRYREKILFDLNRLFPPTCAQQATPVLGILLVRSGRGRIRLEREKAQTVLMKFLGEEFFVLPGFYGRRISEERFKVWTDLCERIRLFRLEYPNSGLEGAARRIEALFEEIERS